MPCPVVDEGEVWLGVRSHQVGEGRDAELVARDVEALGSTTTITCALDEGGNELRITREGHRRVVPGDRVGVALAPEVLHWFDVEDGRRLEST